MHYTSTTAILALSSAAAAAPQLGMPLAPPWGQSTSFRLVANVRGNDLVPSIQDYVLTSYHVGAGQGAAVLVPNDDANAGRQFYVNGSAEDVRYNRGTVQSSGGTPSFPFGIQIAPAPSTAVTINAGLGTPGVGLARFPSSVTYLTAPEAGYVACKQQLPYGEAIALNVLRRGEAVPAGCAEVKLLPECSEGDGSVHETENIVQCYVDVAAIDWSLYIY
ncbi:hypothetical protein V493_07793 [Pseudogymnoascus sp. VKM F-4281 (FW-2241)]|nr:hypothetical protein V493_07793 [Pseudogymnoascus sp. VKM F-4281 (FW-2241)]